MRVPISWLQEMINVELDGGSLADRLTHLGIEVDAVERPGEAVKGIKIGRVLSVQDHPDAERLYICRVDAGEKVVTLVTGAPNVTAGSWVVAALPGASLPDGQVIEAREFRGVASDGMLCSGAELGLPSAAQTEEERLAEGILLLPAAPGLKAGLDAAPVLGLDDQILVLALTPNFAVHCQSILGVAREVGALLDAAVSLPSLASLGPEPATFSPAGAQPAGAQGGPGGPGGSRAAAMTAVAIEAPDGCPHYIARVIEDAGAGPSQLWLQRRLQACGFRPINRIVDATNYVLLEMGQPLHAFDLDRLAEQRIIVRRARQGETIVTLDGVERRLAVEDLVIADARRAQAIAGVMGAADSEVTADTSRILLEAALFNPADIFRTARRHGIRTEASIRFDKGIDPAGVDLASRRAARLIAGSAGRIADGAVDVHHRPAGRRTIALRPERVRRLLLPPAAAVAESGGSVAGAGPRLDDQDIIGYLRRLGFESADVSPAAGASGGLNGAGSRVLQVQVPTHRGDVEGEADLAEEVGRLMGYDRLPAVLPGGAVQAEGRPLRDRELMAARRAMVAAGYREAATWSFVDRGLADRLRLPADHPQRRAIAVANPMTEEHALLRTTLLGGLLDALAFNLRRRNDDVAFFEIGTVYLPRAGAQAAAGDPGAPDEYAADERAVLGIIGTGSWRSGHWQDHREGVDFFAVKGALEYIADRFGADLQVAAGLHPSLHPGRSASISAAGRPVGWLGELHPEIAAAWDIPAGTAVAAAEIDLESLLNSRRAERRYTPPARFPAVGRDVALIAPVTVSAAAAEAVIRRAAGDLLESLNLFDVYEGEPVAAGHRSLAFSLSYRSTEGTLTDAQVDTVHQGVRRALENDLEVKLR